MCVNDRDLLYKLYISYLYLFLFSFFYIVITSAYFLKSVQNSVIVHVWRKGSTVICKKMEKLRKFWKSFTHKQNINGIYNEKLHSNCLQQLPTLRLTTYELENKGNSDVKKKYLKELEPSPLAKNWFLKLSCRK